MNPPNESPAVKLVPSIYRGRDREGDFAWMISQPEYADALFVFNDNERQWRSHRYGQHALCFRGGGNAIIRPHQCTANPHAIGIPTGDNGRGYAGLFPGVKFVLDMAVHQVEALLATGRYRRLIYSAADESGDLGTGIFTVAPEVRAYIVDSLRRITQC